jgi:hypothetical protein
MRRSKRLFSTTRAKSANDDDVCRAAPIEAVSELIQNYMRSVTGALARCCPAANIEIIHFILVTANARSNFTLQLYLSLPQYS